MKLRIKGNSIRLRLTKSDVQALTATGYIEEQLSFGTTKLYYALEQTENESEMSASFDKHKIIVHIPQSFITGWENNDQVGFESRHLTGTDTLSILVEKDFVCLDETTEDQSDNYANPKLNS